MRWRCSYRRVREGNYPVQAQGHTLILNWNAQLVPLLRQMRVAREERGAFLGDCLVGEGNWECCCPKTL